MSGAEEAQLCANRNRETKKKLICFLNRHKVNEPHLENENRCRLACRRNFSSNEVDVREKYMDK